MEASAIMLHCGLDLFSGKAVPLCVLVTGFGKFPGARSNPTALLVRALSVHQARLARLGIKLELSILPVDYAEVARKLEELNETLKPDAILHFGLAARRTSFSIETRALNRLSLLHCDASRGPARGGAIGFIHVPRLAPAGRPIGAEPRGRRRRPNLAGLTRAALIAILVTARKLRQDLSQDLVKD